VAVGGRDQRADEQVFERGAAMRAEPDPVQAVPGNRVLVPYAADAALIAGAREVGLGGADAVLAVLADLVVVNFDVHLGVGFDVQQDAVSLVLVDLVVQDDKAVGDAVEAVEGADRDAVAVLNPGAGGG